LISCLIVVCLTISQITFSSPVSAQSALLTVSTQGLMINGLIVHPENPLQFNFLFSQPETIENESALREDALKQIRYFLASLAIPENDLWVNLSPYEPDRIISNNLSQTEMGRDMLAQDYVLKQLTASLMSPESEQGKIFWDKIHHAAYEKFGVTEIPAEAFNKVWIVPNKSVVFENGGRVYVLESSLRVMLDQDYIAEKAQENRAFSTDTIAQGGDSLQTDLIRQVIAPEIERQINEGEQFATVRQIYHAVLLAAWFKKKLQKSLLGQLYVDQNKTSGIDLAGEADKQKIYNEYLQAFQSGAFDLIKEEYDPATQAMMPHKYFAGGLNLRNASPMVAKDAGVMKAMLVIPGLNVNVTFQSFKNFSLTLILLLAFVSCQNNNPKPAVAPEESIEQAAQDTGATSVNVPPQQGTKAVPPKKRPQAPAVSEQKPEPLGPDVNPLRWLESQGAQRDTVIENQLDILVKGNIFALIWDSQGYKDVVYSVRTNDFDGIYTLLLFMQNHISPN